MDQEYGKYDEHYQLTTTGHTDGDGGKPGNHSNQVSPVDHLNLTVTCSIECSINISLNRPYIIGASVAND